MTYTIAQLFVNYIVRSYQRSQSIVFAPTVPCTAVVQLLSSVRHDYRASATQIDRPPLFIDRRHYLSIVRHDYRASATQIDRPSLFIDRPSLFIDRPPPRSIVRHPDRSQCHANRASNLLIMIIVLGV
ncbi:hypothetical protein QUA97_28120 [Microcoleus sp. CZ3-B2]